jgi:hypothetical protein
MLAYYPLSETAFSALNDQSNNERVSPFSSAKGTYWDYDSRGHLFGDLALSSDTSKYSIYVSKTKAPYFSSGIASLGALPPTLTS